MNNFIREVCKGISGVHDFYAVGENVLDSSLGIEPKEWTLYTKAPYHKIEQYAKESGAVLYNVDGQFCLHISDVCKIFIEIVQTDIVKDESALRSYVTWLADGEDFAVFRLAKEIQSGDVITGSDCLDALYARELCVDDPVGFCRRNPLNILKVLKLAIKYDFTIDSSLEQSMLSGANLLSKISSNYKMGVLREILELNKPVRKYFSRFSSLIVQTIPELHTCVKFDQHSTYHRHDVYEHMLSVVDLCDTDSFTVKFAALMHDVGKPDVFHLDSSGHGHFTAHPARSREIVERVLDESFVISGSEKGRILSLVEFHDMKVSLTKKAVARTRRRFGDDFLNDWMILKDADIKDHVNLHDNFENYVTEFKALLEELRKEDAKFTLRDLDIDGNIIMKEFGLKPGKIVGILLDSLADSVIAGDVTNSRDALLLEANRIYQSIGGI